MTKEQAKARIMSAVDEYEDARLTRMSLSEVVESTVAELWTDAYNEGLDYHEEDEDLDEDEYELDIDLDVLDPDEEVF